MNLNIWKAIIYKKYTQKRTIYQMIFMSIIGISLCLFRLLPIQLNDNRLTKISFVTFLSIFAFFFISSGLQSAQGEINYHESSELYLLVGDKSKTIMYILVIDFFDVFTQTFVFFWLIYLFYHLFYSIEHIYFIQMISFIVGSITYAFFAYFLTLVFKNSMTALAVLLIFPLIIIPYIERMFPTIMPLIIYRTITDTINNPVFSGLHVSLVSWFLLVLVLTYLQIRKRL